MDNATILVVEDDIYLIEGIRDILEINGYQVLTAAHGKDALKVLAQQTQPPDLIVSDIMMPYMDGYEFFNAVRADKQWVTIPFIFLTAKGERNDIFQGKRMGAEDYIVKPFDADELLVTVDSKLKRRKEIFKFQQEQVLSIKQGIMNIINHEFRTPLTYVVAYADMLNQDADSLGDEDARYFLHGINSGANRLRRLVENFILLVELVAGEAQKTFSWRKAPLDRYPTVLRSVESKYQTLAEEQQVTIEIEIEDDLPPIMTDLEYLSAALECLVDNAIKFSDKPNTKVQFKAYQEGRDVCLAVSDQGRGIPEHELDSIFQTFYQIDREKYEDQGAGSGLAIVNGVMQLHQGSVSVESSFGEGSIFTLRFPIYEEE